MKVYKFRTVDAYSLTGLANSEIWFSGLQDFNDPFEGSYKFDDDEYDAKDKEILNKNYPWHGFDGVAGENIKASLAENNIHDFETWSIADKWIFTLKLDLESIIKTVHSSKAVCLSRQFISEKDFNEGKEKDTIYENLLWSHYSSGLRGFCLAFDDIPFYESLVEFGDVVVVTPIVYQNTPELLEVKKWQELVWRENPDEVDDVNYVYKSIATKSEHWSYEKEMRFVSTNHSESKRRYSPTSLIEIIIGDKMPLDQQKLVINTAISANQNVKVKLARLKSNSYELEVVDYKSARVGSCVLP